jgi:uncharacterized membrane protein YcfT
MSTAEVLTAIQNSAVAHAISKTNHLVGAALQVVHVLGFVTLLAALVLVSLRLLGLTLKSQSLQDVSRDASRLLYLGLALTVASGLLMFVAMPKLYFYKPMFQLKMLLFVSAVLIQFAVLRRLIARESANPLVARATVAASLLAWFGIGFAGRMIGFT